MKLRLYTEALRTSLGSQWPTAAAHGQLGYYDALGHVLRICSHIWGWEPHMARQRMARGVLRPALSRLIRMYVLQRIAQGMILQFEAFDVLEEPQEISTDLSLSVMCDLNYCLHNPATFFRAIHRLCDVGRLPYEKIVLEAAGIEGAT